MSNTTFVPLKKEIPSPGAGSSLPSLKRRELVSVEGIQVETVPRSVVAAADDHDIARRHDHQILAPIAAADIGVLGKAAVPGESPEARAIAIASRGRLGGRVPRDIGAPAGRQDALLVPDAVVQIDEAEPGEIAGGGPDLRSEEHTSELQSLMRISYAVFCLNKKKQSR